MPQFKTFEELVAAGTGTPPPRSSVKPFTFECTKVNYTRTEAEKALAWKRKSKSWRKGRMYWCDEHKAYHLTKK
jgi:hypothetical protein